MKKDETWDIFLESMWDYQWLKEFIPLTQELNDAMYDYSQGITSLTVIIFMLAQERALASGLEKITVSLIKEVMDNDLNLIKEIITALRKNDTEKIARYDDIAIDMDYLLENINRDIEVRARVVERAEKQKASISNKKTSFKEQLMTDVMSLGLFKNLDYNNIEDTIEDILKQYGANGDIVGIRQCVIRTCLEKEEKISHRKQNRKAGSKQYEDQDLRKLFQQAEKEKKHVYESLKGKGYIANPLDEFYR
jgi:DUF438 domain-containing protein